jgi:cytochrome c-type biogenesis protein CcmE
MSKGAQIAFATLSVVAGLLWVLSTQGEDEGTFRYYEDVSTYLAGAASGEQGGRASRVHGFVLDGSIDRNLAGGHVDFVVRGKQSGELAVRYLGLDLPDLFRDGAEVVVEGRPGAGRFLAERVLAKCPSKYEVAPGAPAPGADA